MKPSFNSSEWQILGVVCLLFSFGSVSPRFPELLFRTAPAPSFAVFSFGSLVFGTRVVSEVWFSVIARATVYEWVSTMALKLKRRSKTDPKRGPERCHSRKVNIFCAYNKCRNKHVDCKNKPYRLKRKEVNEAKCRSLRPQAATVVFCSQLHLDCCAKSKMQKRGGREALNAEQASLFFHTIIHRANAPWAGVLLLVQLLLGDRADCARQASIDWFSNIHPDADGLPEVKIPGGINGKTQPRLVPLPPCFSQLLWKWIAIHPLQTDTHQWPLVGQQLHATYCRKEKQLLFCGRTGKGKNEVIWDKPISERAYLKQITSACEFILQERKEYHRSERSHVFDEVDLSRIGTHSWKKTAVTLLKNDNVSSAVVSVLTGTSIKTLNEIYDVPTSKRQREAVKKAFTPVVDGVATMPLVEFDHRKNC